MKWFALKHVLWLSVMVGVSVGLWTLLTTTDAPADPRPREPRSKAELIAYVAQNASSGEHWYQLAIKHKADGESGQALHAFEQADRLITAQLLNRPASVEQAEPYYITNAWYRVGLCRTELGRMHEAREAFLEATQILYVACELQPDSRNNPRRRSLYNLACYAARAGDLELAIESFERAIDAKWGNYEYASNDKDLDPIREDPRFQALMERINPIQSGRWIDGG